MWIKQLGITIQCMHKFATIITNFQERRMNSNGEGEAVFNFQEPDKTTKISEEFKEQQRESPDQ